MNLKVLAVGKSITNRPQERLGKLLSFYIDFSSIFDGFKTR